MLEIVMGNRRKARNNTNEPAQHDPERQPLASHAHSMSEETDTDDESIPESPSELPDTPHSLREAKLDVPTEGQKSMSNV